MKKYFLKHISIMVIILCSIASVAECGEIAALSSYARPGRLVKATTESMQAYSAENIVKHLKSMAIQDRNGKTYTLFVQEGMIREIPGHRIKRLRMKRVTDASVMQNSIEWDMYCVRFRDNCGVVTEAYMNVRVHKNWPGVVCMPDIDMGVLEGKGLERHLFSQLLEKFPLLRFSYRPRLVSERTNADRERVLNDVALLLRPHFFMPKNREEALPTRGEIISRNIERIEHFLAAPQKHKVVEFGAGVSFDEGFLENYQRQYHDHAIIGYEINLGGEDGIIWRSFNEHDERLVIQDATCTGLPDNSVDEVFINYPNFAWSQNIIDYLQVRDLPTDGVVLLGDFLAEASRILKDGGVLTLITERKDSEFRMHAERFGLRCTVDGRWLDYAKELYPHSGRTRDFERRTYKYVAQKPAEDAPSTEISEGEVLSAV